jgi:hypothetical protein
VARPSHSREFFVTYGLQHFSIWLSRCLLLSDIAAVEIITPDPCPVITSTPAIAPYSPRDDAPFTWWNIIQSRIVVHPVLSFRCLVPTLHPFTNLPAAIHLTRNPDGMNCRSCTAQESIVVTRRVPADLPFSQESGVSGRKIIVISSNQSSVYQFHRQFSIRNGRTLDAPFHSAGY